MYVNPLANVSHPAGAQAKLYTNYDGNHHGHNKGTLMEFWGFSEGGYIRTGLKQPSFLFSKKANEEIFTKN